MQGRRTKREVIEALKKANVCFFDELTKEELDPYIVDVLYEFIDLTKTEDEFIALVEVLRFTKSIDDYLIENKSSDAASEFYKQHRKTIDHDKNKQLVFCKKFRIIDILAFKQDFKKQQLYLDVFYDDKLRQKILEEQNFKCGLCGKDISSIEPHLHHVDYNKRNCTKENMIFLCPRCHGKTNSKREFWRGVLEERKNEKTNENMIRS